jgi:SAM-dependent methyltransferase
MRAQAFYARVARSYDFLLAINGYRRAVRHIVRLLPFPHDEAFTVLDAGCGTGLYSIAILEQFANAHVVAFDMSAEMVQKMKANLAEYGSAGRVEVFVGDVRDDISYPFQSFDLIITGGVLEYVKIDESVLQLSRYLKPGRFFLNSPVRDNFFGRLVGRVAGFTPHTNEANVRAFTQQGFAVERLAKLPVLYLPTSLAKDAHLFQKIIP